LTDYYPDADGKQAYLQALFDASARHYDRVLRYGFLGMGGNYRLRMLRAAGLRAQMRMLDVACGTGDIMRLATRIAPVANLVGLDPSPEMLRCARAKLPAGTFWQATAESIPAAPASFDFLVMGYALRHVRTLDAAFAEFHRVLKPGGKVLILEISRPRHRLGYRLARLYFRQMLPAIAWVICRDRAARRMMRYFWDSIDACVSPEIILAALSRAGFQRCRNKRELGLFSAYSGSKPTDGTRHP
jgi:demethylmenaquinone methyltransferase/2-methoxy-6-polyprenyl-1,4-benzoquinol methylase